MLCKIVNLHTLPVISVEEILKYFSDGLIIFNPESKDIIRIVNISKTIAFLEPSRFGEGMQKQSCQKNVGTVIKEIKGVQAYP